ncbi:MAG: S-4TM family putative pore-forming effector [Acidithiobacillus sp.]|nr:S-4TM family putative pore-forming effector [Acidithiobacillus sp.]
MNIQERQNLPEALEKLAAQRLLYRRAKLVRNVGMLMVLVIAVLALIGAVVQNKDFNYGVTLAALFTWFFDQFFLKEMEGKNKREAAAIQEDFDCAVLDIPWPAHKRAKRPTHDRIRQLAVQANKNPEIVKKLRDWYTPSAIPEDKTQAQIHCQRVNCWWDVDLRKRWRAILSIAFWAFVVIAILLAIVSGITVAKFVALVASGLRILAWGIGELKGQDSAIKNIQEIHEMLNGVREDKDITVTQIRCFQDEIFDHRRTNPPVPEWFFWWNRDRQEAETAKP